MGLFKGGGHLIRAAIGDLKRLMRAAGADMGNGPCRNIGLVDALPRHFGAGFVDQAFHRLFSRFCVTDRSG